jgi:hypothetical protein
VSSCAAAVLTRVSAARTGAGARAAGALTGTCGATLRIARAAHRCAPSVGQAQGLPANTHNLQGFLQP